MADNFSLGNNGKFGKIDFSKLRAGIKKEEIAGNNAFYNSLFNKFDLSGDGVLSRQEIQQMVEMFKTLAMDDGELTIAEAKKFQIDGEKVGQKNSREVFAFINKLAATTYGIKSVEMNGTTEVVILDDGTKEEVFEDGSKRTTKPDGSMVYVDKNGIKLEEIMVQDDKTVNTKYENGKKVKETTTEADKETVIEYKNGEEAKKIITTANTIEKISRSSNMEIRTLEDKNTGLVQTFIDGKLIQEENKNTSSVTTYRDDTSITTTKDENSETVIVKNKDGNYISTKRTEKLGNDSTKVTKTEYEGENTTTTISVNGKNLSQTKVVDGVTYTVNYDGEGNTTVIVQNGESITALAKKFGCTVEEIINANSDKVKGKGTNRYFLVGEEIKIPRELPADSTALQNRKSATDTQADYAAYDARIKAEQAAQAAQAEAQRAEAERVEQKQQRETEKAKAKELAQKFYDIADHNSFKSMDKMLDFLQTNIDSSNIVDFLNAYTDSEIRKNDSSIIDTITSEVAPGLNKTSKQKKVLYQLINTLCDAAREAGVSEDTIKSLKKAYVSSMNEELDNGAKRTDPTKMEIAVDSLLGQIAAAKSGVQVVSEEVAMEKVAGNFNEVNNQATEDFEKAREEDSWIAKAGDKICGWFGCNTVEEMRAKLGDNADKVERLMEAANNGDKAEFKRIYKELFGVEFDANLIAASEKANEDYMNAVIAQSQVEKMNTVLSQINDSMSFEEIANMIANLYSDDAEISADEVINEIIKMYKDAGISAETEEEKKTILLDFVNSTKEANQTVLEELTATKSLDELAREAELIGKSAFGTNDISKMVSEFNQNMIMTDAIGTAAVEIGATILLQFVPGVGQIAAARLATSAARLGVKGVKIVKYAEKAGNVFRTISKLQSGTASASKVVNTATKIGMQSVSAGAATAAVGTSKNEETKDILKRALLNASFAGAGATSNIVAPKLMQVFGVSKQVAVELAEEIINAAAAYGITTISGDSYGTQDAFLDIVTGMVMARIGGAGATRGAVKGADIPEPSPRIKREPKSKSKPIADPKDVHELYSKLDATPVRLKNGKEIASLNDVARYFDEIGIIDVNSRYYFQMMWQQNPNRFYRVVNTGLFDLVANGHIDMNTFKSLIPAAGKSSKQGSILSHRTLADIKMMKEQIDAGITKPSAVKTMPKDATNSWINKNVKVGEVYQNSTGELFIKVDSGNFVKLKMTKEKYDELFPLIGNTAFKQGANLGDCWLVSALDGAMDIPMAKAQLLSLFEQVGDDIYIKFPKAEKPVVFRNGEIIPVPGYQITGNAKGIQMLEQAYSIHRYTHYGDTPMSVVDITDSCLDLQGLHNELKGGFSVDAWGELFVGKRAQDLCSDFQAFIKNLKNVNNLDCMVNISFRKEVRFASSYLFDDHAYMVKSFDVEKGMLYLTNPHNTSTLIEVPISVLEQNFSKIKKVETFSF